MGQVRIIGGIHRSRIIRFKDDIKELRPTPDRVRETLFNWLAQDLTNKSCLDLFAGSGILGFEAISRNAKRVVFNELNKNVVEDLKLNKATLKAENAEVNSIDAEKYIENCTESFDLIFLDPPYKTNLLSKSLSLIKNKAILKEDGIIYIEYEYIPDLTNYEVIKQKKAGMVNFALIKHCKN